MRRVAGRHYADLYGPTAGDRVRLGDTYLWATIERDLTSYGDECVFGGGKVLRDRMGQAEGVADADALDCVLTNALIIDWSGIYKADIGIKGGRIAGIGKAGNPRVMGGGRGGGGRGGPPDGSAPAGGVVRAGGVDHPRHRCR